MAAAVVNALAILAAAQRMKKPLFTQPLRRPLRSGYTTGACATAAAKGAALMLAHQITVREVTIELPAGVSATFQLSGQNYSTNSASCFVIKDAGDDPDVTNGAEIHATILRDRDPLAVKAASSYPAAKGSAKSPSRDWRCHRANGPSTRSRDG